MTPAQRQKRVSELMEFHAAIADLLAASVFEDDWAGRTLIKANPARLDEWSRARARVEQLTVRAAHTMESVGVGMNWKPPGGRPGSYTPINPAASWSTILSDRPMFGPVELEACINRAIGALQADLATEAPKPEKESHGILVAIVVTLVATVVGGLIVAIVQDWWGLGG